MIVYHVISARKLKRYILNGKKILPPVRAWDNISSAERFSKQTGRAIILRLKFPDNEWKRLPGHKGEAVFLDRCYDISSIIGKVW